MTRDTDVSSFCYYVARIDRVPRWSMRLWKDSYNNNVRLTARQTKNDENIFLKAFYVQKLDNIAIHQYFIMTKTYQILRTFFNQFGSTAFDFFIRL